MAVAADQVLRFAVAARERLLTVAARVRKGTAVEKEATPRQHSIARQLDSFGSRTAFISWSRLGTEESSVRV